MRLDVYLAGRYGLRSRAAAAIKSGEVLYANKTVTRASFEPANTGLITFMPRKRTFVSAGGYKLAAALDIFGLDITGFTAADIGASSGGFCDCLLQYGAQKVYAVDVGENQLAAALKNQPRITVMDKTNAKTLKKSMFGENLDLITADLSFISVTKVLDALKGIAGEETQFIVLVKPQFEAENKGINKNGIVTDRARRMEILSEVISSFEAKGFRFKGAAAAPVIAGKNTEYLLWTDLSTKNSTADKSVLDKLP